MLMKCPRCGAPFDIEKRGSVCPQCGTDTAKIKRKRLKPNRKNVRLETTAKIGCKGETGGK